MKIFISVDLEGVGGYVKWDIADRQRERELITYEANAAIAGVFEGGATEVLVTEAHANMRNIIPELIDDRAIFLSGEPKPLNHMAGIDNTFNGAMFVGYHSKAGTLRGVMAHTFTGRIFSLKFNELEVGEIGTDAAIAGHFGVPVIFVSGDTAACEETKVLIENAVTASTKEGISRYAAKCLTPNKAQELIKKGAKQAMEKVSEIKPFRINPPIKAEVTYIDPSYADSVENLDFIKRVNGTTVTYEAIDFVRAFEIFNLIKFPNKPP